jgi:hypothetical protein
MSQKEQLADFLAARAEIRQKQQALRQARIDLRSALKGFEQVCDDIEGGQGMLPFDASKPPKKPPGGQSAGKAGVG